MAKMTQEREGRILETAIEKFGKQGLVADTLKVLGYLRSELEPFFNTAGTVYDKKAIRFWLACAFVALNQMEMIFDDVTDIETSLLETLGKSVLADD